MFNGDRASLRIGIHGIRVITQRGDLNPLLFRVVDKVVESVLVFHDIDMGHPRVAADRFAHRPAADLHA